MIKEHTLADIFMQRNVGMTNIIHIGGVIALGRSADLGWLDKYTPGTFYLLTGNSQTANSSMA